MFIFNRAEGEKLYTASIYRSPKITVLKGREQIDPGFIYYLLLINRLVLMVGMVCINFFFF